MSAELQTRVAAAATRLGYQANLAARALAAQRSRLIGVVATERGDPLLDAVLPAALAAIERQGYGCLITAASPLAGGAPSTVTRLLARGVDALLFAGGELQAPEAEILGIREVPWVMIGESEVGPHGIALGRTAGAELACRYLLDLGHRWLAGLGAAKTGGFRAVRQTLAVRTQTRWSEVPFDASDRNSATRAIEELLAQREPPTAILCDADVHAFALLRECSRRALAVPRDLSVVGFGDEPFARYALPALTTVRTSAAEAGAQAVAMLLAALAGREPEAYVPRIKLVVRESTGPAPV